MVFRQKVVGQKKEYTKPKSLIQRFSVWKIVLFVLLFAGGLYVFSQVWNSGKEMIANVTKETVKVVAKKTGESMVQDTLGNINVMVVGYAGEDERGGYLTDTIMVASYNPDLETVTFLSIPRDLYVTYHKGGRGKVNGAYRAKYIDSGNDHEEAAEFLMEKVSEITGVYLQYYAFVSFDGFVDFVDSLGGVTIDVPEDLVDPYYPDNNNGFETLVIEKGIQTLDGEMALKYARSRKTTSDFSRTIRQQQIVKGVVNQVIGSLGITNITKAKQLYDDAIQLINTNITPKEMLGMVDHVESNKRFFSFVYTADCDKRYLDFSYPGCVLVNGDRGQYGSAVILPIGATPGNIDYYKHTKDFAFWVIHNQKFLLEAAPIRVLNGIDKERARRNGYPIEGVATSMAIELKTQAFTIEDVGNSDLLIEKSIVYVPDLTLYEYTVDALRIFVDIDEVLPYPEGEMFDGITLVLGNDYMFKE